MKEYNKLTQRLLAEGYTPDNYPDYVRLTHCSFKPYDIYGGFEYTKAHLHSMTLSTPCGLLTRGDYWTSGHMSFMGIDWRTENDNPVINCPYRKSDCKLRHPLLRTFGSGLAKLVCCDCRAVPEPYDYERSLDKVYDEAEKRRTEMYNEFSDRVNGRVCHWHMYFDEWADEWKLNYSPLRCASSCMNIGRECQLRGCQLSKKKGNVFYDVKLTTIRNDDTLFSGQEVVSIHKGKRYLEKNTSLTICEEIAKKCLEEIQRKEEMGHHRETFYDGTKVEILNLRAEQRESRDLIQDLEDIKSGCQISHASDIEKRNKEAKKERRQMAKEKKIQKLEQMILNAGYENLERSDRYRVEKLISSERIEELESERRRPKETEPQIGQLNLFKNGFID